jgi:hypothetical protein
LHPPNEESRPSKEDRLLSLIKGVPASFGNRQSAIFLLVVVPIRVPISVGVSVSIGISAPHTSRVRIAVVIGYHPSVRRHRIAVGVLRNVRIRLYHPFTVTRISVTGVGVSIVRIGCISVLGGAAAS